MSTPRLRARRTWPELRRRSRSTAIWSALAHRLAAGPAAARRALVPPLAAGPAKPRRAAIRRLAAVFAAAPLLAALAGCGAPRPYDPAAVLRADGRAMAAARSLTADVAFGPGAAAFGFNLDSAHTTFRRPADSDTTVRSRRGDTVVQLEVVTLSGHTYLRVPILGWEDISNSHELSGLPDFARLMDVDKGLPAVVPLGTSPVALGHQEVDGHDCYHLGATYTGDEVAQVITVLHPAGPVAATLWVDASTDVLRRIRLEGPLYDAGSSTLEVHFSAFGASVSIAKPPV